MPLKADGGIPCAACDGVVEHVEGGKQGGRAIPLELRGSCQLKPQLKTCTFKPAKGVFNQPHRNQKLSRICEMGWNRRKKLLRALFNALVAGAPQVT
ncbi:hypothetical protein [Mesorhizobium sp. M1399]|uniref:hypothetical protein n=1 Tax=Mesorhizobium sp. M1399 TaxID=2957096 RepID=UPI0033395729